MTGVLAFLAGLLVLLAWFFWPGPDRGSRVSLPPARHDADRAELEAAEREVQEASDAESVRDWGPGAGSPPVA